MKAFVCILISALAICTLVPTSGYDVQPLYGRTFNLFNLLTSPQALLSRLTSLTSRFAILQSTVDILSSQFTALRTIVTSLQAQITALQKTKCPIAAPGGAIISGKCYTVATPTSPITFADAQSACSYGGGTLAEPTPPTPAASQLLYSALRLKFPTQFTTIETTAPNQIWIGYKSLILAATTVVAPISGATANFNTPDLIFGTTPIVPGIYAAAIQAPVGNLWTVLPTTAGPKAYICQYSLV